MPSKSTCTRDDVCTTHVWEAPIPRIQLPCPEGEKETQVQQAVSPTEKTQVQQAVSPPEKKKDMRGAHWIHKINTSQAPQPAKAYEFWAQQTKRMEAELFHYMHSHASSIPILRSVPVTHPRIMGWLRGQRRCLWMYLYLQHLKGVIHIDFHEDFFRALQMPISSTASATHAQAVELKMLRPSEGLSISFETFMTQDDTTSFGGIRGFDLVDAAVFNAHPLFPMPSAYFDDVLHPKVQKDRTNDRVFGQKTVIQLWRWIGMREESPTRMRFDFEVVERIRERTDRAYIKKQEKDAQQETAMLVSSKAQASDAQPDAPQPCSPLPTKRLTSRRTLQMQGVMRTVDTEERVYQLAKSWDAHVALPSRFSCLALDSAHVVSFCFLPNTEHVSLQVLATLSASAYPEGSHLPIQALPQDDVHAAEEVVQWALAQLKPSHTKEEGLLFDLALSHLESAHRNLKRARYI
jgi:hypothetical protein